MCFFGEKTKKMVKQQQQQLLCLDRLIQDLQQLNNDHQTADVIFIVDNNHHHQHSNESNNNELTKLNDNNDGKNDDDNDNQNTETLYAHRLILRARCQNFKNVSSASADNICCRKLSGSSITKEDNGQTWIIRWPKIKSYALRLVLNYIYTSKIELNSTNDDNDRCDDKIFDILIIAYDFDLDELIEICEQRILEIVDVNNVCRYLDRFIEIGQKIHTKNGPNCIIDQCMEFINENAYECVKTESFRNISKETMIHLLRSDHFSLDEADVFRSLIEWAKYQTNVYKSVEHWNDDDRKRIQNQLSGVINHLRILLIDSQVFAEEIEPTGVIPIELSLERYRFAALAINNNNNNNVGHKSQQQIHDAINNKRLQPRSTTNIYRSFPESKLLSNINVKYEQTLNDWYGHDSKQRWQLIFRASEHKFSAEAFHNYCDGIAPTFVLVLSTKGYLSGGFSDIPWTSGNRGRGCYASSEKSFLFRLKIPSDEQSSIKYDVKKKIFAIGHMASKGPVFGAGADLLIADSCHLNEDSYSNLPHSYDGPYASVDTLFGSYYFTVIDYEVFTLFNNSNSN
uniref:Integrator complex subunit 1 homolog n=1 Tax=Dermatophagoides pteronyssinus TaxID=6956 RepID=A0A6P6XUX0_DERPT|nr:integrator complex subunit 1 homolog [Dermatophagoides pteronyssinus]